MLNMKESFKSAVAHVVDAWYIVLFVVLWSRLGFFGLNIDGTIFFHLIIPNNTWTLCFVEITRTSIAWVFYMWNGYDVWWVVMAIVISLPTSWKSY